MKKACFLVLAAISLIAVSKAQFRNTIPGDGFTANKFHGSPDMADIAFNSDITKTKTAYGQFSESLPLNNNLRQDYEFEDTRKLVALVKDAAEMVSKNGESAFSDFRVPNSRWRKGETYIFVLDTLGNMIVHEDKEMEGKNQINLKDINGKPIIQGLIRVTTIPGKPEGWYHYQWPVPGGLLPRWKSSYVRLVKAPTGKSYIVGSGAYNDRMEREFVVDMVKDAVAEIEKNGKKSFKILHDHTERFLAKNAYIFVITMDGIEIVNPAFPSIEGRNNIDIKDPQGKYLTREIIKTVQTKGSGWVDYMWPKPGESVPSQKSAYVMKAMLDGKPVAVGCGIYLPDATKASVSTKKMTAPELMALVRKAAGEFEKRGEKAFPDFRQKGSQWFKDDTYFFVWSIDGVRIFHAADSTIEGKNAGDIKDALGRPYGKMFLAAASGTSGEGWIHYQFPEPGELFPTWKSSFVKRVTFPSGKQYLIGSGIYNMQMDKLFIEDLVERAAVLVAEKGKDAFPQLRDKTGSFMFMDTYIFVDSPDGTELVNAGQPSVEGQNLMNMRDLKGKLAVQDYIGAALKNDSAWVDYYWYKPGENTPSPKHTYVRKVQHGNETYIIGAGIYNTENSKVK
ncbi:MAG: cache domain-containing protein [Bacteroidia bacterium]